MPLKVTHSDQVEQPLPSSTRTRILLLMGAMLLATLVVVPSFFAFQHTKNAALARRGTFERLLQGEAFLSAMKDAETAQRGYLISGDDAFLAPYFAVRDGLLGQLEALRKNTLNPASQRHLDALRPITAQKLAEMAYVIDLRRNKDLTGVQLMVAGGKGMRQMDTIRAEIGGFLQLEEGVLASNEADFQARMRFLFTLIVAASLLAMVAAIAFVYQQSQQLLKDRLHKDTENHLHNLAEANQRLQEGNSRLQESEEKLAVTLNSIGDGVIATDDEGRVSRLNPVAELLTGWLQQDALGRPVNEIFRILNQDTRLPAVLPVMETLLHGTLQGLANHTLLIARNGSECSIADSCSPIRDRSGTVQGAVLIFRDVTKEYAVQRTLADRAARIRAILDTVADGIVIFQTQDCAVESGNPALLRLFGYTLAELVGKDFALLIPDLIHTGPEGPMGFFHPTEADLAIGSGREVLGRRKDGTFFPLEITVTELEQGEVRFFVGVLRDLTLRKQAETALAEAGRLQNAIFNSAHFSSIATDEKGVIQIFNVGAERMLGYTAAEVKNLITPADISDSQELITRAKTLSQELGTVIEPGFEALVFKASRAIEDIYELTYIRKDGTRFPAVVSITALRAPAGDIIGYLLIGTDNTKRKEIEEEQKLLTQRLLELQFYTRSLFEANIDALVTTDPVGIISDANKQMEILTGCSRSELIGAPFNAFFTDPPRAEAAIELVLEQHKVTDYELTASRKGGFETVVSCNATTFYDQASTLQGVFAAARDISERKHLDQALEEKRAELETARAVADKANHAKSEFLSSMSHELRSPLNAILGFAQLLDSEVPAATPSQKASIDQILHAGWYLLELINEILDLSAIESGKLSMSVEPVSIAEVMAECEAMVEPHRKTREVHLTFPAFPTPHFVKVDRIRLKQILINLLSNAIKYNRQGGQVQVGLNLSPDGRIRVAVSDTGHGLPPKHLAQLFQPFNRLGQEGGTVEGTGIGLVMSKLLVEMMGGIIGVESTVGEGSTFWFEFPSSPAPQVLGEPPPSSHPVPPPHRVGAPARTLLYIEDNLANLELVEQLIGRRPDLSLLTAVNAREGLGLAHQHLPDAILMDINLPGISGIEALRLLRLDPTTAGIPVLAISANAMLGDIHKGLAAGFFRYLTKPIKVPEFMKALDEALDSVTGSIEHSP